LSAKIQAIRSGGPRDEARLALAIAISNAAEARRAVDNAKAAIGRAGAYVSQCEERLASAVAAGIAARDNLARRVTASAVDGSELIPDGSLRACRLEEIDAEDSCAAAKAALAATEILLEEPADELRQAALRVSEAARVILARHLEPARADVARLAAALTDARATLWFLHREVHPWPPTPESERIRFSYTYLPEPNLSLENPGAASFAEYFSRLQRDADAQPPT
jgi:hypothetical protein